jgi:predicted Fe-Mo cluster-binding NifX family protein
MDTSKTQDSLKKVAISTDGGNVSAHFGRCPAYTIVEIANGTVMSREEIHNPGHEPGFLPGYLAERGVKCIVAGGMGPRAQMLFEEKGIETILGISGSIEETVKGLAAGTLQAGKSTCDHGPCG